LTERVRELVRGEGEGTRRRAWSLRYYRLMTRASAVALALAAVFAVAHDSSGAEPEQPPSSSGAQSGPRQSPTEGATRPPAPPRPTTQTPPLPPDRRLPGVARFFLYEEPVSPYLNPHRN